MKTVSRASVSASMVASVVKSFLFSKRPAAQTHAVLRRQGCMRGLWVIALVIQLVLFLPLAARAVAPDLAGCKEVTTTFASADTPLVIPAVPPAVTSGTTTSTITVSGTGTYLSDVDVTTFITHTWSSDLDITLTSPAGTTVTLTTDNAVGMVDVFDGTVWDDQADDRVTDHLYTNLVLASPLTPEGALGAFRGEDPNGVWTLTVVDDSVLNVGTLTIWSLSLTACAKGAPATKTHTFSVAPGASLANPGTSTFTQQVITPATSLCGLRVTTNISHTANGQLSITLASPAGTTTTLTTGNGGANVNVFAGTVWRDDGVPNLVTDFAYVNLTPATPLVPEEALSLFNGEDPNGIWTLSINDVAGPLGAGTLNTWGLDVIVCKETPSLTLTARPRRIGPGETSFLLGRLKDESGAGMGGKRVQIKQGAKTVKNVTTKPSGSFTVRAKILRTTNFKAFFRGDAACGPVTSRGAKVTVR